MDIRPRAKYALGQDGRDSLKHTSCQMILSVRKPKGKEGRKTERTSHSRSNLRGTCVRQQTPVEILNKVRGYHHTSSTPLANSWTVPKGPQDWKA